MATASKIEQRFTYADYLRWPEEERWELIDGEAFDMTPAPDLDHQDVVGQFYGRMFVHLRQSPSECRVFLSPIDVVFDDTNVLQPDLAMVCNPEILTKRAITGAPNLVIEVLSPSTFIRDKRDKWKIYERFGVETYLIVDVERQIVERYKLMNGTYGAPEVFAWDEELPLEHPKMTIPLWEIFGKEKPTVEDPDP
jgi:Uma2 family endonuclease